MTADYKGVKSMSWTRPMHLGAAALLTLSAIHLVAAPLMEGFPITTGFAVSVLGILVLLMVGIVGSLAGWRWMFWAVAVYFGFVGGSALTNLTRVFQLDPSMPPLAVASRILTEGLALIVLAYFIWMLIGLRRFGPWAMRKLDR
jgi:hypothetical protein